MQPEHEGQADIFAQMSPEQLAVMQAKLARTVAGFDEKLANLGKSQEGSHTNNVVVYCVCMTLQALKTTEIEELVDVVDESIN